MSMFRNRYPFRNSKTFLKHGKKWHMIEGSQMQNTEQTENKMFLALKALWAFHTQQWLSLLHNVIIYLLYYTIFLQYKVSIIS